MQLSYDKIIVDETVLILESGPEKLWGLSS
jgi:hypothetical protein